MIRQSLKGKRLHIAFFVTVVLLVISANSSFALPLHNPVVGYDGQAWATFRLGTSYVSWYTEYNLTSDEYGKLDAFCVENQNVYNPSPYSLSLDFSNSNLREAAILADLYFSGAYFDNISSQTAYQAAIWTIMFDGLSYVSGGGITKENVEDLLEYARSQSFSDISGPISVAISPSSQDYLIAAAPVPEPATMLLIGTGLIGLAGLTRKKMLK